jgi:hypothetical protein
MFPLSRRDLYAVLIAEVIAAPFNIIATAGITQAVDTPEIRDVAVVVLWLLPIVIAGVVLYFRVRPPASPAEPQIDGNTLKPRATDEELAGESIDGRTVYIADLIRVQGHSRQIRDRHFVDCDLVGPAVLHLGDNTAISGFRPDLSDDRHIDELVIGSDVSRTSGVAHLTNCLVRNCRSYRISFIASNDVVDDLRQKIRAGTPAVQEPPGSTSRLHRCPVRARSGDAEA